MKTTARRQRSDSAKAAVKAMQNASLPPLEPPECVSLREQDKPFWKQIVTSKARDNWTSVDLVTAAQLARAQADIEALQKRVDIEGYIVGDKINPAATMLETLSKRATSLMRILQVHAISTVGRSPDAVKSAKLEREAHRKIDDDGLIPTLRAVQ